MKIENGEKSEKKRWENPVKIGKFMKINNVFSGKLRIIHRKSSLKSGKFKTQENLRKSDRNQSQ